MALRETPFGQDELAKYEIHIPQNHPRGRHAGGDNDQLGSKFSERSNLASGNAVIIDLRAELAEASDTFAITPEVVRLWVGRAINNNVIRAGHFGWDRVLIQTLTSEMAASEAPLAEFPHFSNEAAVDDLMYAIRELSQTHINIVVVEPPSVDHVDQCEARDAFRRRGITIGENFDFSGVTAIDDIAETMSALKVVRGQFEAYYLPQKAPHAVAVAGAYFFPRAHAWKINQNRNIRS